MELMMVGPYLVSQLIGGVLGAGMAKVSVKSISIGKLTMHLNPRIPILG